ncbi:hypothetical protein QFC22_000326 [Naganishia vaughanmartiniae]|uniref:Uncharacterized protein n=1 Tax=Naganishia vaughanmartiniae TaxID=1424756 RepID=A0ACC2XQS3_9TREE|nr:hypothetical protein QFC22_000326 [Naganishia vaughanmartiniae]
MAPPPIKSHVTGASIPPHYIHADTAYFRDTNGRSLILRGVNLSGSAKAPVHVPAQKLDGFWQAGETGEMSFIGRPLDLEDGSADVHLGRLRAWGFNCLRFVFTWEAIEHAGPGKIDQDYLDYVVRVLKKIKEYGFIVFMDPHQDIWSRFCGGSGAPLWTIHACGLEPRNFTATKAAYIQNEYPDATAPRPQDFPAMIWSTNYTRLACQTIFTMFFAGRDFAPLCVIDGMNIQDYLQAHYLGAVEALMKKLVDAGDLLDECVIGWDSINEPGEGLIGHTDLSSIPQGQALKKGPTPTAFQGMKLGMGQAVQVQNWKFGSTGPSMAGRIIVDPQGVKAWLDPGAEPNGVSTKWGWKRATKWKLGECVWAQHGIWDPETATLIRPDYFAKTPQKGDKATFVPHYWKEHWIAYATLVRKHHPEAIHFVQPPVFVKPPSLPKELIAQRMCLSPHFYDGLTLLTRHWNWFNADAVGTMRGQYSTVVAAAKVGEPAIRRVMQDQLAILKGDTSEVLGQYPTLMGEIGIPYDMDDKKAYGYVEGGKGKGDYSVQQRALDSSLNACDGENVLNWTMWTYVPDHSHQWGDQWNLEDLSIWSPDDLQTPGKQSCSSNNELIGRITPQIVEEGARIPAELLLDGARAVSAFCRPYPIRTVGRPKRLDFDISTSTLKLCVSVNAEDVSSDSVMTEIYLPFVHYAAAISLDGVEASKSKVAKASVDSAIHDMKNLSVSSSESSATKSSSGLVLDLEVSASKGRWETQGQYLRWFYPVPAKGEATYTIEISRKGGVIPERLAKPMSWMDMIPQPSSCVIA